MIRPAPFPGNCEAPQDRKVSTGSRAETLPGTRTLADGRIPDDCQESTGATKHQSNIPVRQRTGDRLALARYAAVVRQLRGRRWIAAHNVCQRRVLRPGDDT